MSQVNTPSEKKNQIRIIRPYRFHGQWVFDDESVGLDREPFVAGADDMIDRVTVDIPNAKKGFLMLFSEDPFPGHQVQIHWLREEMGGNVYAWNEQNMEGWLCPALLRYFHEAPEQIYIQIKADGSV